MNDSLNRKIVILTILGLFWPFLAISKPSPGICLSGEVLHQLYVASPSIERGDLVVMKAVSFDAGTKSYLYLEVAVNNLGHAMGHWFGPILMEAGFEQSDWSEAIVYLIDRKLDDRELRRANEGSMRAIIEQLARPFSDGSDDGHD